MFTIAFLNKSYNNPEVIVWVCMNETAYRDSLEQLKNIPYIEIVQSGLSVKKS